MRPTDFATQLTRFLGEYLPAQKNLSPNTIRAYRDVFTLFLRYCRDQRGLSPEHVELNTIDVPFVLDFLNHLETERKCSARTRNHRLSALHAFFRYLQTEEPARIMHYQQILAIPFKRFERSSVHYLSTEELEVVLAQPDLTTAVGRRDAVLLSVLYDTGARVQELVDLDVRDVRLHSPAQIHLTGKGGKTRAVPLLSGTVDLLAEYVREHNLHRPERLDSPLFCNRRGERLSRSGVRYILEKYTEQARRTGAELHMTVTPHTLRHSKAMHLLHAGNSAPVIQAILGHADVGTVNIYARANMEMMRGALEKAASIQPGRTMPSWQENQGLMDWLRSL
jgi:integrase/recombinase XerD